VIPVDLGGSLRFFDMRFSDDDRSTKRVTVSPKGLVSSYVSDLSSWGASLAANFAVVFSLFAVGGGFVLGGLIVGLAAVFHWIEVNYGLYCAYGIIGSSLSAIGALFILLALRPVRGPKPHMPLGERQMRTVKRAIASTALTGTSMPRRSPLATDPVHGSPGRDSCRHSRRMDCGFPH
jgi:hypothetical protein